jgi:serine protease Do
MLGIGSNPHKFKNGREICKVGMLQLKKKRSIKMKTENVKRIMYVLIALIISLNITATAIAAGNSDMSTLRETSEAFSNVAEKAIPAVVFVKVEKTVNAPNFGIPFEFNGSFDPFGDDFFDRFFRRQQPQESPREYHQMAQGSGCIISADGYILTNHHVVGDVDKITVKLHDGQELEAKVIGSDEKSDVAVIKVEGKNLPVLPLGDSDKLKVGEWVIAIGNPFGLAETVTVGVVSAKGRSNVHIADYEDFIQTDAAINPGNSGGPLLNLDGQVIGINTAIFSQSGGYMGIGFAIPINMAKSIKEQLLKSGKVTRGQLGISIQALSKELADSFNLESTKGILVADVLSDSPAEKAGLKTGDIILKLNGDEVTDIGSFRNKIAMIAPGTNVKLLIMRDGKQQEISVEIGELSEIRAQIGASDISGKLGLQVQDLTEETAKLYGVAMGKGIIVTGVAAYSPAAMKGIKPGAVILSVNRKPIGSVLEFNKALKEAGQAKKVLLLLKEDKYTRFVVLSWDK